MSGKVRVHIESLSAKPPHMHITGAVYQRAAERHPELARRVEVSIGQDSRDFDTAIADADVLFGQGFPTQDLARRAPRLRWVSVASAGVESLMPLDWLPENVVLTNNSGVHRPRTREYALMMLLALNQHLPKTVTDQRAHRWAPAFRPLIEGKSVLIVGFGNLGLAVAEAARTLGMRIVALRRSAGADRPSAVDQMLTIDALPRVLPEADFVVITVPLTAETRGLFDPATLASMKAGAGIINLGRGPVLDAAALGEQLRTGHISGAVLDVFDTEPLPEASPIWDAPNLIVTPHNSSDDPERYIPRSLDLFFENLERFLEERPLANVIDRERGY